MIARFNSNIEIESHLINMMHTTVHRNYSVEQNGHVIATGWVKDLTDYTSLKGFKDSISFKNTKDRDGRFVFNGEEYHIGEDVRWGSEWPFYDSKENHIMSLWDASEKVQVEIKKLFSKETVLKQRSIGYQRIITEQNNEYRMYPVSFGKEGEYYILYKGDIVVSTVYLHPQMRNYGRTMDLYMEDDDETILVTLLYCFSLVMYCFYRTNTTIIQENGNYKFSMPKSKDYELAKFDSAFMDRIKALADMN